MGQHDQTRHCIEIIDNEIDDEMMSFVLVLLFKVTIFIPFLHFVTADKLYILQEIMEQGGAATVNVPV